MVIISCQKPEAGTLYKKYEPNLVNMPSNQHLRNELITQLIITSGAL